MSVYSNSEFMKEFHRRFADLKTYAKSMASFIDKKSAHYVYVRQYLAEILACGSLKDLNGDLILPEEYWYTPIRIPVLTVNGQETLDRYVFINAIELARTLVQSVEEDSPITNVVIDYMDYHFTVRELLSWYDVTSLDQALGRQFKLPFPCFIGDNVVNACVDLTIDEQVQMDTVLTRDPSSVALISINVADALDEIASVCDGNIIMAQLYQTLANANKNVAQVNTSLLQSVLGDRANNAITAHLDIINLINDNTMTLEDRAMCLTEHVMSEIEETDVTDSVYADHELWLMFDRSDYSNKAATAMWSILPGLGVLNVIITAFDVIFIKTIEAAVSVVKAGFKGLKKLWKKYIQPSYKSKDFQISDDGALNLIDVPALIVGDASDNSLRYEKEAMVTMLRQNLTATAHKTVSFSPSVTWDLTTIDNGFYVHAKSSDMISRVQLAQEIDRRNQLQSINVNHLKDVNSMSGVYSVEVSQHDGANVTVIKPALDRIIQYGTDWALLLQGITPGQSVGSTLPNQATFPSTWTVGCYAEQMEQGGTMITLNTNGQTVNFKVVLTGRSKSDASNMFDDGSLVYSGYTTDDGVPYHEDSVSCYLQHRNLVGGFDTFHFTSVNGMVLDVTVYRTPNQQPEVQFVVRYVEYNKTCSQILNNADYAYDDILEFTHSSDNQVVYPTKVRILFMRTHIVESFALVSDTEDEFVITNSTTGDVYKFRRTDFGYELSCNGEIHDYPELNDYGRWSKSITRGFPKRIAQYVAEINYVSAISTELQVTEIYKFSTVDYILKLVDREFSKTVSYDNGDIMTQWEITDSTAVGHWYGQPISNLSPTTIDNLLADVKAPIDAGCVTSTLLQFGLIQTLRSMDDKLQLMVYLGVLPWKNILTASGNRRLRYNGSAFVLDEDILTDNDDDINNRFLDIISKAVDDDLDSYEYESGDVLAYKDTYACKTVIDAYLWLLLNIDKTYADYLRTLYLKGSDMLVLRSSNSIKWDADTINRGDFVNMIYADAAEANVCVSLLYSILFKYMSNKANTIRVYQLLTGEEPMFIPYTVGPRICSFKYHIATDDEIQHVVDHFIEIMTWTIVIAAAVIFVAVKVKQMRKKILKVVNTRTLSLQNTQMAVRGNMNTKLELENQRNEILKSLNNTDLDDIGRQALKDRLSKIDVDILKVDALIDNGLNSIFKQQKSLKRWNKLATFFGCASPTAAVVNSDTSLWGNDKNEDIYSLEKQLNDLGYNQQVILDEVGLVEAGLLSNDDLTSLANPILKSLSDLKDRTQSKPVPLGTIVG